MIEGSGIRLSFRVTGLGVGKRKGADCRQCGFVSELLPQCGVTPFDVDADADFVVGGVNSEKGSLFFARDGVFGPAVLLQRWWSLLVESICLMW